jgi:hypothetical protein
MSDMYCQPLLEGQVAEKTRSLLLPELRVLSQSGEY